jgi:hypothetical protein
MAKGKGFLEYGKEDGESKKDEPSDKPKSDKGHESAGEMLKMELLERFLQPPFGGDKTDMERKRGQLEAFGRLLECYGRKGG